jgi:hypothetical protein
MALMLDQRCSLFDPARRAALESLFLQSRGALLRNGASEARLAADYEAAARSAELFECDGEDTLALAESILADFEAWLALPASSFAGEALDWDAEREALTASTGWLTRQSAGGAQTGLVMLPEGPALAALLPGDTARLTRATLSLRNPQSAPELFDITLGGLLPAPDNADWVRYGPPDHASRRFYAAGRIDANAGEALGGTGFFFLDDAVTALAEADPREAARVDFIGADGRPAETVWIEIGDFAAARAFIRAAIEPEQPDYAAEYRLNASEAALLESGGR